MNVREARRTRNLVIQLDESDELVSSLVRALDNAEARSGFITGSGTLAAADLAHDDSDEKPRRIAAPCELVSLSGTVARLDGATSVRLSAVLSRETDAGVSTIGGQLVWAHALAVELHVVAFDDLVLTRAFDDSAALLAEAEAAPPRQVVDPEPKAPRAIPLPPAPPPQAPPASERAPAPPQRPQATMGAPMALTPARPKPKDDVDIYPDVGDSVMHFHFGECIVISSDGDRIRLRQERDGRVREVALTMLRIEPPTLGTDGTRHFKLHRKN